MWADFFASFGGMAVAIGVAYAALRKLSVWFIEHELAKSLVAYKAEFTEKVTRLEADLGRVSDVLSRKNEREFAATEAAWDLVLKAVGTAQGRFGPFRNQPCFAVLSEADALKLIDEGLNIPEREKQQLRDAAPNERDDLFEELGLPRSLEACRRTYFEFSNWLSTREIFMPSEVFQEFMSLKENVFKVLDSVLTPAQGGDVAASTSCGQFHRRGFLS